MCKDYRWVISLASLSGVFQSLLWMGFGISGALLYLCLLPVDNYRNEGDFLRVTLVKLYFEGPKCKLDGSYLGQFETDYKTEINMLTQDKVFGIMIAYFTLNAIYFVLSILFYKYRAAESKRAIALGWSTVNLVICAIDFLFTYVLVLDVLSLKEYLSNAGNKPLPRNISEVVYIPLIMAMLSSRFIAGWLWNFVFGSVIFLDALCCQNLIKKPSKTKSIKTASQVEQIKQAADQPQKQEERTETPLFIAGYDDYHNRQYPIYKMSMEAMTRFNTGDKPTPVRDIPERGKDYPYTQQKYWHPQVPRQQHNSDWEMENEGFVSDEEQQGPDFDHDLRNFEAGQRKIQIMKPPIGKPVETVRKVNPSGGNRSLRTHTRNT